MLSDPGPDGLTGDQFYFPPETVEKLLGTSEQIILISTL